MKLIIQRMLEPLVTRLGTIGGTWLVAQGIPADTTQQIVTGISALALVGVDMISRQFMLKKLFTRNN